MLINLPVARSAEALKENIKDSTSKLMATMTLNKFWGMFVCRIHELIPYLFYPVVRVFEPELPSGIAKDATKHTWEAFLVSFDNVLLQQNFSELVKSVGSIPILIIASSEDEYLSQSELASLKERKNVAVETIPGGHDILIVEPELVAAKITTFLDGIGQKNSMLNVVSAHIAFNLSIKKRFTSR